MKVKELVEKYNKNQRIDISKEIESKQYVSIVTKREMASLILDNCTTIVDGEVHIDSLERYLLFTIAVISIHTNLEFLDGDEDTDNDYAPTAIDNYDALCESGLLAKIIDTFKDDYASCQEVLNMMTADRMQDNMTIEKKIGKFLDEIQDILGNTINNLSEKLNFDNILGNSPIDQDKFIDLFNSIKKD